MRNLFRAKGTDLNAAGEEAPVEMTAAPVVDTKPARVIQLLSEKKEAPAATAAPGTAKALTPKEYDKSLTSHFPQTSMSELAKGARELQLGFVTEEGKSRKLGVQEAIEQGLSVEKIMAQRHAEVMATMQWLPIVLTSALKINALQKEKNSHRYTTTHEELADHIAFAKRGAKEATKDPSNTTNNNERHFAA
jgi:hypothetical protein